MAEAPAEPEPEEPDGEAAEGEAPLANSWVVWAQREPAEKVAEFQKLGDFSTVEQFWAAWRWIPPPSEVFTMPAQRPPRTPVVAICLFKEGVEPRSDHKSNAKGGKWSSLQITRRGERLGLGPPTNILEDGVATLTPLRAPAACRLCSGDCARVCCGCVLSWWTTCGTTWCTAVWGRQSIRSVAPPPLQTLLFHMALLRVTRSLGRV